MEKRMVSITSRKSSIVVVVIFLSIILSQVYLCEDFQNAKYKFWSASYQDRRWYKNFTKIPILNTISGLQLAKTNTNKTVESLYREIPR